MTTNQSNGTSSTTAVKVPTAVVRSNNYGKIGTIISNTTTATTCTTSTVNTARSSGSSVGSDDRIPIISAPITCTTTGSTILSSQASVSSVSISSVTLSSASASSLPITPLPNLTPPNEVITESMEESTLDHIALLQPQTQSPATRPLGTVLPLPSTLSKHPKRVRMPSDITETTHDTTATTTTTTTATTSIPNTNTTSTIDETVMGQDDQDALAKQRWRTGHNKLVDVEVNASRSVTSVDSITNPATSTNANANSNSKVSFVPSSIVTTDATLVVDDTMACAVDDTEPIRPRDPAMELKDELYKYMREEPGMFDWIQEALGDGVFYYDMADVVWYSPAYKTLFGYTEDEVPNIATWWQENIFPEDLVTSMQGFQKHIECGTPYDQVVRYRHKDGSTVWVRCHGKAIFNDDGIPVRMLGCHNDLTELMKVQEKLKEKEAILHLLCTTSLDGYWDWDMTTGHLQMSARFKNLLGYDDSELPNRIETWWSLLHPDDLPKLQEAIAKCTVDDDQTTSKDEKPPLLNIVLRYRRKNGTIARMLAQGVAQSRMIQSPATPSNSSSSEAATAIPTKQWIRMFGTHTDVSYLEEARAARDASAAKTTFLATMSHEIRTPLNAVLGMAQVLMTTSLTEEQKDCVTTLHNSGMHLLSLINDILDFSQIEAGIISLTNEEVDIQCTVRNVLDVLQLSAQQKDVVLSFETTIPANKQFYGDSERIRQIVFNVLGNAVKFTSHGSVHTSIQPRTNNSIKNDGASNNDDNYGVEIVIMDTGCGIAPDQIDCIFEDFRQAGHEIRSKYGGSGLGLSICKKLIQSMGGTITVESVLGQGSTFTVWLPGLRTKVLAGQQVSTEPAEKEANVQLLPSSIHPITREQPQPPFQSPNKQNEQSWILEPNGQKVSEKATLQQLQIESNELDATVEPYKQQVTKFVKEIDDQVAVTSSTGNCGRSDNSEVNTTTLLDQSSIPIRSFEIDLPTIYLYEELVRERGSVKGGLSAAGMSVCPVSNASEIIQCMLNPKQNQYPASPAPTPLAVKVVLHNQGRNVSEQMHAFVADLLRYYKDYSKENPNAIPFYLYDVGRNVSCDIPDKYKSMYTSLPCFPTSDEFYQDVLGENQNHVSKISLFRQNLRPPDGAASAGGGFLNRSDGSNLLSSSNGLGDRPIGGGTLAGTDNAGGGGDRALKILVAEDNIINQKVMRRLLSRFACEMEVANNGLEAVERARNEQWDLIFMDLIMPELDGLEAAKTIRQTDSVTPIVALTANATTDDRDECFEAGMNDFITKPVSMDALRKLLHKICSNVALANPL